MCQLRLHQHDTIQSLASRKIIKYWAVRIKELNSNAEDSRQNTVTVSMSIKTQDLEITLPIQKWSVEVEIQHTLSERDFNQGVTKLSMAMVLDQKIVNKIIKFMLILLQGQFTKYRRLCQIETRCFRSMSKNAVQEQLNPITFRELSIKLFTQEINLLQWIVIH